MADNKSGSESSDSERDYPARREQLPDAVDHFLGLLLDGLQTRNVPELHRLYEDTFNKLTEKHYKNSKWPSVEAVSEQVSDNQLFLIFYKELYYRHIYSRSGAGVPFNDRAGSWENYCQLLDLIIDCLHDDDLSSVPALPAQWIWDLLDEFVYHYQTYCNFRNKAATG